VVYIVEPVLFTYAKRIRVKALRETRNGAENAGHTTNVVKKRGYGIVMPVTVFPVHVTGNLQQTGSGMGRILPAIRRYSVHREKRD